MDLSAIIPKLHSNPTFAWRK